MRVRLGFVALLIMSCGVRTPTATIGECDANAILRAVSFALKTENASAEGLLLTSLDVDRLNGIEPARGSVPTEFDRVIATAAASDLNSWRREVRGQRLEDIRMGTVSRRSVEGLAPDVEVMRDSILTFRSERGTSIVRIEEMYRIGECWKIAEIGSPRDETAVGARPSASPVKCLTAEQVMSELASALVAGRTVVDDLVARSEDLQEVTSNGIAQGDARRLAESIRFDAANDFERWAREIAGSTAIRSIVTDRRPGGDWLGPGIRFPVLKGEITVRSKGNEIRTVPVNELVQAGECVKLVWLGSPP